MFVGITNTPRDYAWGSHTAIASLLGREASGGPEAELWLGAHPESPSVLTDGSATLIDTLGGARLPFLMKVLAASGPLSLQAHPTMAQAAAGFARENALGIALDDPARNYRDAFHKPEMMYVLSDEFTALCGFRPVAETRALLTALGPPAEPVLDLLITDDDLPAVFEWLIGGGQSVAAVVREIVDAAALAPPRVEFTTVSTLASFFPGDPGIVVSLLLNVVTLHRGEALYLPAGNIHAYIAGLGIEVMASSDNVLRGGLTRKHIDAQELLSVLDFRPLPVPYMRPNPVSPGVVEYRPDVPDFVLTVVTLHQGTSASVPVDAPVIALAIGGSVVVGGESGAHSLAAGAAAYISGEGSPLTMTGDGTVFVASGRNPESPKTELGAAPPG